MKKSAIALLLILVLCFTVSCSARNREQIEITNQQIENRIEIHKIRNEAYYKTFQKSYTNEQTINTVYEKVKEPTDYEGVANRLAEAEVIRRDLENIGKVISFENAKEYTDSDFALTKTDTSQALYHTSLKEVLEEHNISEDKFLELLYEYAYDFYNLQNAQTIFANSEDYNASSEKSLDEQFAEYKAKLMKKADITYK